MAIVDHYIGAKEYSIFTKTYLNYHKYVPCEYSDDLTINEPVSSVITKYYNFFDDLEANKGFLRKSLFKTTSCGIWISEKTTGEIDSYHPYFSYDYRNLDQNSVDNFYNTVVSKVEPTKLKELRSKELDIGIEGISISLTGEVLKYITLFRPNSNVLSYFPDLEQIEKVQNFVDLNYDNFKKGFATASDSFKSPIRIQFDSNDNRKVSIELVSAFFQKEYYLSGNSYSGYLDRKQKYFDRMVESGLLNSEEVEYCKQHSPSWQQFSIKFKWQDGQLIDKKLYTFVVVDFEEVE